MSYCYDLATRHMQGLNEGRIRSDTVRLRGYVYFIADHSFLEEIEGIGRALNYLILDNYRVNQSPTGQKYQSGTSFDRTTPLWY